MGSNYKTEEVEVYTEEQYKRQLDEIHGEVLIGSVCYSTSYAMAQVDPMAFRVGFADFQEYETRYVCEHCEDVHDDKDDARECCEDTKVSWEPQEGDRVKCIVQRGTDIAEVGESGTVQETSSVPYVLWDSGITEAKLDTELEAL
jgi:hypothetical protein